MVKCVLKDSLDHNSKVKTTSTHLQVSCGLFYFIFFPTFCKFFFWKDPPHPLCFLSSHSNIILLPSPPTNFKLS